MDQPQFRALGQRVTAPSKDLDGFPTPANVQTVSFTTDELTSFCPVTGQPDFNHLTIEYAPDATCVESKSLKLYLWTFREEHIFGEGLAHQIVEDLYDFLQPHHIKITLSQGIRGGLKMTVVAEKSRD